MADIITLTQQPIRITATARQNAWAAVDVSGYDILDMELVCTVEGTSTTLQFNIFTGMHFQSDDGWFVTATTFPNIAATGVVIKPLTLTGGFLRYIRWDVSGFAGLTAVTFFMRGMARRYA